MVKQDMVTAMLIVRKSKRMTQIDIADKVGISQGEVSLLENGHGPIRRQDDIAEILGMTVEELTMSYEDYLRDRISRGLPVGTDDTSSADKKDEKEPALA